MKIVDQSVELIWITKEPEKMIELAGRVCFSPDTELLTQSGWKFLTSIDKNENIWTYNKDTNSLEMEQSNIFSKYFDGELIESNHRHCSFSVTPDHRMVAKKIVTKNGYDFVPASRFIESHNNFGYRVPLYFKDCSLYRDDYVGQIFMQNHEYFSGKPLRKMEIEGKTLNVSDDFLTIVAAYVSDGHINSKNSAVHITKGKDKQLIKEVTSALDNLDWHYTVTKDRGRDHILSIRISGGKPVACWFEENCGRGSLNKKLPDFWADLSKRQLTHLLKILYLGDGKNSNIYTSSSTKLINQVNHLYVLIGESGSVIEYKGDLSGFQKNKNYHTNKNKRDNVIVKPSQVSLKKYKGQVYCPQTKNGIVCIRRNGQTMWIGNCYKSEGKITDTSSSDFVSKLNRLNHHAIIEHASASFRIITDRGVMAEITRHRIASFAVMSTRYCNFKDDKFNGEISVVEPPELSDVARDIWEDACFKAENRYFGMLIEGCSPQIARSVLPTCLATEIVMTANFREWIHFIKLRGSKAAHPQIRPIAKMIQEELKKYSSIFDFEV